MNQEKYIGMDVHVMDARGKLIMECILEKKAATILEFIQGLHGSLSVTFEEGISAAWFAENLNPADNAQPSSCICLSQWLLCNLEVA